MNSFGYPPCFSGDNSTALVLWVSIYPLFRQSLFLSRLLYQWHCLWLSGGWVTGLVICVCVLLTEWKELLFVTHIRHLTAVSDKQKEWESKKRRNAETELKVPQETLGLSHITAYSSTNQNLLSSCSLSTQEDTDQI